MPDTIKTTLDAATVEAERAQFEPWAESEQFCITRDDSDKYRDYHRATTRWAWSAWLARAEVTRLATPRGVEMEAAAMKWRNGEPPKPWRDEWFIAEIIHGDKVVLRSLPEDFSYDYKTADETYMMAKNIKRWMQFPNSAYIPCDVPGVEGDGRDAAREGGK